MGKRAEGFGKVEPYSSNTVTSCDDGPYGDYHNDESIDKITVASVGGQQLQEGGLAQIEAKVYAWRNGVADTADFYYAADALNPTWNLIGSVVPPGGADQNLIVEYILPPGDVQVIRVHFRYSGDVSPCHGGNWDDVDDLVFAVAAGVAADAIPNGRDPVPVAPVVPLMSEFCKTIEKNESRCKETHVCSWKGKKCKPKKSK